MFTNPLLWWKFEGRYIHYEIKYGISNLITWFPIIWKDRNFDHYFILELLKHKLKFQSHYFLKTNRFENSSMYSKQMKVCSNLIEKINSDYYGMEYSDYYESEMEFIPIEGSDNFSIEFKYIKDNLEDYFIKYPLIYKKVINSGLVNDGNSDTKLKIAREMAQINDSRAKDLLFKIMRNNIDHWWA